MTAALSLKDYLLLFRRYFLLIILGGLLGALISYGIMTWLVTPTYQSQTELLVNRQTDQVIQVNEIGTNIQLINTYEAMITGQAVLSAVSANLDDNIDVQKLREAINVDQPTNSQTFYISAEMPSPDEAQTVVAEVTSVFRNLVDEIYGHEVVITELSPPSFNDTPVQLSPSMYLIMGTGVGLLLGMMSALLIEMSDSTLRNEEYFIQNGMTRLGSIKTLTSREKRRIRKNIANKMIINNQDKHYRFNLNYSGGLGLFKRRRILARKNKKTYGNVDLVSHIDPYSIQAEQFNRIRTNIEFAINNHYLSTILITSSIPAEGKTMVATNLAYTLAKSGKKVLLVDGDLRRPTIHHSLMLENDRGLSNLLSSRSYDVDEIVSYYDYLNISVLTAGIVPTNPTDLLASEKMDELLVHFQEEFDLIIIDTPPINVVTDALVLARKVDSVVLVARSNYTKMEEIKASQEALDSVDADLIGYIINDVTGKETNNNYYYTY